MMAQSSRRCYVVGDYVMGKQIGLGSFSTVWHARHRVHGTEVAVKEIATARLNSKLQESLKSEIVILRRINHPNIIRLHDMIEESGKIYIVLEYCKGGDLSMYIQRCQGRIPEATAKYFMQQLAEGLKVLRENNLIHRDLKPQNLLLSTTEDNSVLKIADFGFARSLQPRGLAETLCGSPLYMAPEIMQSQKYDAKADLWSVGAILFQLVTGKTPFTGSNQIQLLQNIIKSTDLQFPPEAKHLSSHCIDLCRKLLRPNPVERLTFEEFFNHPYLCQTTRDKSLWSNPSERLSDDFPVSAKTTGENSQDYYLPFSLDDDSSSPDCSPSSPTMSTVKSLQGFFLTSKHGKRGVSDQSDRRDSFNYSTASHNTETTGYGRQLPEGKAKLSVTTPVSKSLDNRTKAVYSLEPIDQGYVMVPGPSLGVSSLACSSKTSPYLPKTCSMDIESRNKTSKTSAPVPIIGGATGRGGYPGNLESLISPPGALQQPIDVADTLNQASSDYMVQIKSLQHCASTITELVRDKIEAGNQLEAFSLQLVILAIWKHTMHTCHTYVASATDGSPMHATSRFNEVSEVRYSSDAHECLDGADTHDINELCSQIEKSFLREVENAEELAKAMEHANIEMPDAMELIYQSALGLGRRGAVDEYMGDVDNAVIFYSKAVMLLRFLLIEAPSLTLNPQFTLTNSDRYRIQNYIDVLNNRQSISRSQRMTLLKASTQPSSH